MVISPAACFKAGVAVLVLYLFSRSGSAYVPIAISFALAFVLYPIVRFLTEGRFAGIRLRLHPALAILCAFVLAACLAGMILIILIAPLLEEFGKLYRNVPQILLGIHQILVEFENSILFPLLNSGVYEQQSDQIFSFIQQAITGSLTFSFNLLRNLANMSIQFVSKAIELIVVPVLTFYFIKDWRRMTDWCVGLFSAAHREKARTVFYEMGEVMSDFLRGQFLLCLIIGALMFAGLYALGIEYPLVLGLLAGVTEAIPIVGPILSSIPAIILGTISSPALGIKVALFCFLLQQMENHIIVPKVMGGSIDLHPVIVIVSILIGGQLLGIVGMIAALPATALLKVFMRHFWITEGKL